MSGLALEYLCLESFCVADHETDRLQGQEGLLFLLDGSLVLVRDSVEYGLERILQNQ